MTSPTDMSPGSGYRFWSEMADEAFRFAMQMRRLRSWKHAKDGLKRCRNYRNIALQLQEDAA